MLQQMARHMDSAYCGFAPGAAEPVLGLLNYFEDEIREHISQQKCPFTEAYRPHRKFGTRRSKMNHRGAPACASSRADT